MTIIKNLDTYCVLACLESFLTDEGKPKSWKEIRDIFCLKNLCDRNGTVYNIDSFLVGCQLIGIDTEEINFHYPIREEFQDGSLFILTTDVTNHCYRFYSQDEPTKIIVMDPDWKKTEDIREFEYIDEDILRQFKPRFIRLRLQRAT
jgi:hypothetical protein